MGRRVLVRRYALALAELAAERRRLDEVEQELARVMEAFRAQAEVRRAWYHVHLSPQAKVQALRRVLGDQVSPLVYHFLGLVARKGRETLLPQIFDQFLQEADRIRGVVRVEVESATPLDPQEEESLKAHLARFLGARGVRLSKRVDPNLIGGLAVRAGDVRIDGTLSRQLARLHQTLRSVPIRPSPASLDGKAG
ncbi:ATP synthase F1 subunit delta [Carboxydochorda subterranea]|uniref:ATP synthase subunit delta n=1 Tax=Carboxydichorda subterranea TaxID=3109565 RepID=A0ABZ1BVV8_9FIRM|nr:ATP synthase F1 subunit delta [Limnochorda sp. L945t]WRP16930.1 ATP synthase F1 subunit delta [Limnochorda sp. L945t]